jgi:hypothetical protein
MLPSPIFFKNIIVIPCRNTSAFRNEFVTGGNTKQKAFVGFSPIAGCLSASTMASQSVFIQKHLIIQNFLWLPICHTATFIPYKMSDKDKALLRNSGALRDSASNL